MTFSKHSTRLQLEIEGVARISAFFKTAAGISDGQPGFVTTVHRAMLQHVLQTLSKLLKDALEAEWVALSGWGVSGAQVQGRQENKSLNTR